MIDKLGLLGLSSKGGDRGCMGRLDSVCCRKRESRILPGYLDKILDSLLYRLQAGGVGILLYYVIFI